jgi:hypothetical protein
MRITEAARRLDMTPRMLRYREALGLLPPLRRAVRRHAGERLGAGRPATGWAVARPGAQPVASAADPPLTGLHRQFTDADLAAVALGVSLERRYDISPIALAFGIRVLADPRVRADVAELGRRIGRIQPPPARALDFEQERAQRLLRLGEPALPAAAAASQAPIRRRPARSTSWMGASYPSGGSRQPSTSGGRPEGPA